MQKDCTISLEQIIDAVDHIERYVGRMTYEEFVLDEKTHDAVVLQCALIGEATRALPDDFRSRYDSVEWSKAVGMRDRLIHDYPGIDYEIVWNTIKTVLPAFKAQLADILREEQDKS